MLDVAYPSALLQKIEPNRLLELSCYWSSCE
uniref:Uncharacterized protein n=1 Tax=Arundo donax TaxID=35708 RepID=A0A0A8YSJ2_ARUDO